MSALAIFLIIWIGSGILTNIMFFFRIFTENGYLIISGRNIGLFLSAFPFGPVMLLIILGVSIGDMDEIKIKIGKPKPEDKDDIKYYGNG